MSWACHSYTVCQALRLKDCYVQRLKMQVCLETVILCQAGVEGKVTHRHSLHGGLCMSGGWRRDRGRLRGGGLQLGSVQLDQQALVKIPGAALHPLAHRNVHLDSPRQWSLHGQLVVQQHQQPCSKLVSGTASIAWWCTVSSSGRHMHCNGLTRRLFESSVRKFFSGQRIDYCLVG